MVTTLQQPSELDLAYGPVIVTLTNIDPSADKYAVRVLDALGSQIGFVTQSPNEVARAQFDIRKIVQTLPKAATAYDESFGSTTTGQMFRTGGPEIAKYTIEVGVELNGVFGDFVAGDFVPEAQTSLGDFVIMNGNKMYYARDWYNVVTQYEGVVTMSGTAYNDCVIPADYINPFGSDGNVGGRALTDAASNGYWDTTNYIPPGWPTPLYYDKYMYFNVQYDSRMPWQISWINEVAVDPEGPAIPELTGIEAIEIQEFDIDGNLVVRSFIPNTIFNGGGANLQPGDGLAAEWPYTVLNMQAGYDQLNGCTYQDMNNNPQTFEFATSTVFYYIIPRVYSPAGCPDNIAMSGYELSTVSIKRGYGFMIRKQASYNCADSSYTKTNKQIRQLTSAGGSWNNGINMLRQPNPLNDDLQNWTLFSWMNSFGYRDYWYFFGTRDIKVKTKQDFYRRSHNDFNGPLWDVEADARGKTVFAGHQTTEITVNSGYMPSYYWQTSTGDFSAEWASTLMHSLYTSSDVRVWMNGHQALDKIGDTKKMWSSLPEVWNKFEPVIITNKQYDYKESIKDGKLYQYEIQFQMANNMPKQSGEHA